jgi:tetratricopeptide (TPR) repeat protein
MVHGSDRLDGWKAIAGHFGRDRTTVIRWAQERGLPVRHVPGGKTKTVFALRSELEAWARQSSDEAPAAPAVSNEDPQPTSTRRRNWLIAAVSLALISAFAFWLTRNAPVTPADRLPADPAVATLYIQGREHWGQRTSASIARAIPELEAVTRADPAFAPAQSALADAFLLAREFGSVPDAVAFNKARRAAERARQLDPGLASSHRALGFVAYWWEHDRASAGRRFRRAIELEPDDAQTRFWYGNVLADNGESRAALRELNAARLAEPGSVPIETDLAWALWSAGRTEAAIGRLRAVLARSPDFAVAHECLSLILLSQGDYSGYLRGLAARQRARADPELAVHVSALEQAMARGGVPAVQKALLTRAVAAEGAAPFPNHAWAAFLASVAGDRGALLDILRLADRHREIWGSAGFRLHMARRWQDDREIVGLLQRRAGPRMEPSA